MKAIILAAGCGRRLRPYTDDRPKCLVPFAGQSLLQRQIETLRACGVDDICLVTGYLADRIAAPTVRQCVNREYEQSEIVASLRCAEAELTGDVLISYGDTIYERRLLGQMLDAPPGDVLVALDEDWQAYYTARFGSDAPARRGWIVDAAGERLVSVEGAARGTGAGAPRGGEREGQYLGLIRLTPRGSAALRRLFQEIEAAEPDERAEGTAPTIARMRMRDLCTTLIARGLPIRAVMVRRGWLEFDSVEDYRRAVLWHEQGTLCRFITL